MRRRISTRVAAETIKKAIEEGNCGSQRAVAVAKDGDACLQVRKDHHVSFGFVGLAA